MSLQGWNVILSVRYRQTFISTDKNKINQTKWTIETVELKENFVLSSWNGAEFEWIAFGNVTGGLHKF